jgi:hypothetical protein
MREAPSATQSRVIHRPVTIQIAPLLLGVHFTGLVELFGGYRADAPTVGG